MAHPSVEAWLAGAPGRYMNPDGVYDFQCVDVPIDYARHLWPAADWERETFGRNNANGHMHNKPAEFWQVIWNAPGIHPRRGDVIIWGGDSINPYGHIAVVLEADGAGVRVIEQNRDMSGARPASDGYWGYDNPGTGMVMGWLRPKLATITTASIEEDALSAADVEKIIDKLDKLEAKIDDAPRRNWSYDQNGKTKQAWHYQKNVGAEVWGTKLKDKAGRMYSAAANLVNNNANGWLLPGIKRLLEKLATKSDLSAAVEEINAETKATMADAVVEVEVTINDKETI